MIFVYIPAFSILIFYRFGLNYNVYLSIFLTPLVYLILSGILIWYQQFSNFHNLLNFITPIRISEQIINNSLSYSLKKLLEIDRINKIYVFIKVKIILVIISWVLYFIPMKEEPVEDSNLQQDYLEILRKNRNRRSLVES
jgi:hypothetical protein